MEVRVERELVAVRALKMRSCQTMPSSRRASCAARPDDIASETPRIASSSSSSRVPRGGRHRKNTAHPPAFTTSPGRRTFTRTSMSVRWSSTSSPAATLSSGTHTMLESSCRRSRTRPGPTTPST